MKKTTLSILVMLFSMWGYAQELPKIIPPSPEAVSMAKFTETPVSHFTGLPNISIPIYTIKEKGLSIPISLNYHARGIQVEEIASRVGLGWTLNYGGSLSRQIRGGADEGSGAPPIDFKLFGESSTYRQSVSSSYVNFPSMDWFPDLFYFNVNGQSGKFVIDYMDDLPLVQKYNDLLIVKRENSFLGGFVITNKDGVRYYFGKSFDGSRTLRNESKTLRSIKAKDSGVTDITSNESFDHFNSWMLTDIITPNGGHIQFIYERIGSKVWKRSHDKLEEQTEINEDDSNHILRTRVPASYISEVYNDEYFIKEIIFSQGKIVFNKSSIEREDITGGYTLESIEVLDTFGKKIKKYNLDYTYTTAASSTNQSWYLINYDRKANNRLFLNKVTEESEGGNFLPPYSFEYSDIKLPSRFSNSQDYWGYYNGAANGRYLTFYNYNTNIDRRVDTLKSEAGVLKKITFPTGGSRRFIYEHNNGKLDINTKGLVTNTINPLVTEVIDLSPKDHVNHYDGNIYRKEFIVGEDVTGYFTKTISFADETGCSTGLELADCKFQVSIEGPNGEMMLTIEDGSFGSLSPGNYTLKVRPINHTHNPLDRVNDDFYVRLEWKEKVTSEYLYAAGKRIKRIENYDINNELKMFKEYSYNSYDDNWNEGAITSGKIFSIPNFYTLNEEFSLETGFNVTKAYGAGAGEPFSTYQGNSIGYKYVTEYYGDQLDNIGKIVYKFTVDSDSGNFTDFPYHLPTDNDWLRGLNLSTRVYDNTSDSYNLIKEVNYDYLYRGNGVYGATRFMPKALRMSSLKDSVQPDLKHVKNKSYFQLPLYTLIGNVDHNGFPIPGAAPGYKVYHITGGTVDLKKTEETNYFNSGSIQTTTNYFYDYDTHYQLAGSESINSKGELYKTNNEYEKSLIPFRVLPKETKVFKDGTQLSHQKTEYSDQHNSSNLYLPSKVQTSKGSQVLEDRVVYHSYDDKGNPVEVSKADGTHIVYLWGYNKTQPIAKLENTTLTQLTLAITTISDSRFNTLEKIQSLSNKDNDRTIGESDSGEGLLRKALNKLRNLSALSKAQVTTFTYDPLIGVTSITDSRGETIYYQYDSFNRLEFVKDAQGNILKEHKYNYKN